MMLRDTLIKNALGNLSKLSDREIIAVSDFAEFLLSKSEDRALTDGIQKLAGQSNTFEFLKEDEDLYTLKDLKEVYK